MRAQLSLAHWHDPGAMRINMPDIAVKDYGDYCAIRVLEACSQLVIYTGRVR